MQLLLLVALLCRITAVQSKAVFAHFMVGNTASYSASDWADDITQAKAAHIDAFALNIAYGDSTNDEQLPSAFAQAASLGFQLFFSFDYAGNGAWPQADVISLVNQYKSQSAYYFYNGKAFVSTFEGVDNTEDWPTIIGQTGCFFIPSWSSLGAKKAMETGIPMGLFSWGAWPEGPSDMLTMTDESYIDFLDGLPYMMPASPWFFTNLPGYHKNWLWRGDDMWYDRWTHVWFLAPDFVEIITWNDYGESHYIGPNRDKAWSAFDIGEAPYNYASGMPHDGWRLFLPYVIDVYKNNGVATISQEGLVAWFRPQPGSACATGGTTGNTASQLQIMYNPAEIMQDKIFFTALLGSHADVTVTVGGVDQGATWTRVPDNNVGLWHGNVTYHGTGEVVVTVSRSGATVAQVSGGSITTDCTDSIENWNAWVGSGTGPSVSVAAPSYLTSMNCTAGTGSEDYAELCAFACHYNYCPSVCTCTQVGIQRTDYPKALGINGCPAAGYDVTFKGLCSFGCNYGVCPKQCTTVADPSDCNPPAASAAPIPSCTAGTGIETKWNSICSFACALNFCPNERCICTFASWTGNTDPGMEASLNYPADENGDDYGLCYFACNRGFCPNPPCYSTAALGATGDDVTTNPTWSQSKLAAIGLQNSVFLISYWTTCQENPQCGPGFTAWGYGHGKVYDADLNAYIADGCTGGPGGFNRAFCVETGVNLGSCRWRGTPSACNQGCARNEYLLTQNTHPALAKGGCKSGHFSSFCCTQIEIPDNDLTTCPSSNLNNIVGHGLGAGLANMESIREWYPTWGAAKGTIAECGAYFGEGSVILSTLATVVASGAIAYYKAGIWQANGDGSGNAVFSLIDDGVAPTAATKISSCTTQLDDSTTTTTSVTSTHISLCANDIVHACANYHSVASYQSQWILTCPWEVQPGRGRPIVAVYTSQHTKTWTSPNIMPNSKVYQCERDEYPPRAFMPKGGFVGTYQRVRLIPKHDNYYGGRIWNTLCHTKEESTKKEGGIISDGTCQSTVSIIRKVNALYIQYNVAQVTQFDDYLSKNPCTIVVTDDVGFAILADDAWYKKPGNTGKNSTMYRYNYIPPSILRKRARKRGQSDEDLSSEDIEVLALHGYHIADSEEGLLDTEFITVDLGNATRRADAGDLHDILQILGRPVDDYEIELVSDDYPNTVPQPPAWEPPVTVPGTITITPTAPAAALTAVWTAPVSTANAVPPLPVAAEKNDSGDQHAQRRYEHAHRHIGSHRWGH